MFPWIKEMMAQVPSDWKPQLESRKSGDIFVGLLPGNINQAFRAARYAQERADTLRQRLADDIVRDEFSNRQALELSADMHRLRRRGQILELTVYEATQWHFQLGSSAIAVRAEGVVRVSPRALEQLTERTFVVGPDGVVRIDILDISEY